VLCWGLAAGDRWLLPWAALVASLLVQTHLSYLFMVPILGFWGVVALLAATWGHRVGGDFDHGSVDRDEDHQDEDDRDEDEGADHASWRNLRLPVLATAAILVAAWSQPAIDQVTGAGNVSRLLDAGSGGEASYSGLSGAARVVGGVVVDPATWFRGGTWSAGI